MNEKLYNQANSELDKLEKKIIKLKKEILEYENENKRPVFTTINEITSFIMHEPAGKGALFEYDGNTYEVGNFDELVDEYGYESVVDGMNSKNTTITDLVDSYSIIDLIKK